MRTDETLPRESFRNSDQWQFDAVLRAADPGIVLRYSRGGLQVGQQHLRHSFSGYERNHLFLNRSGTRFVDLSAISGLDNIADSRSFVLWDYDRDGWQDIALVNANYPLLNVYHNQIGRLTNNSASSGGNVIAIRLAGGNDRSEPSGQFGPRDGFGAMIDVELPDLHLKREYRCGEGFAAQNSSTILIGIGNHQLAQSVSVRWPTGKQRKIERVAAGTLLTVYENPAHAPDGTGFHISQYRMEYGVGTASLPTVDANPTYAPQGVLLSSDRTPKLRMYTTMATWCEACHRSVPQLAHLRDHFGSQLAMYGVPIDGIESREHLEAYANRLKPNCELLVDASRQDRGNLQRLLRRMARSEALPSSLVTDDRGRVIAAFPGIPTASQIAKLLMEKGD